MRFSEVLGYTISKNQSAFIAEHQILNASLVTNELVENLKRRKQKGLVFKMDFEKAYDMVNWGFQDKVLGRKGFRDRWRLWIKGCISSVAFSVIVNGQPREWFKGQCGVRQGDPLSPFLFTLAVDVLSRMLRRRSNKGIIQGLGVRISGCKVSHLQFADDTILFLQENKVNFLNVLSILQIFELVSGLRINLGKSGLASINIQENYLGELAGIADCAVSSWPITYLGIPLRGNPQLESFWDPVIQRISRKLDTWKGAYFSLGGRVTLVQASLASIPLYFLSLFNIPVGVALKIEKTMRDFLWSNGGESRRDHLVNWEVCCRSKEAREFRSW